MRLIFLSEFGKAFIPQRFRPKLREYIQKTGIEDVPYALFGGLFYLSLLITALIFLLFVYPFLTDKGIGGILLLLAVFVFWFITQLIIIAILMSIVYFYFDIKIFTRTKEIEKVLAEFLQFVAENLKGGMSFDKALWSSVKPQFTVLASEVRIAAKKAMTGEDVEEALTELGEKYDSPSLKRSLSLIVEGMRGGGQVAEVIDRVVENLKKTHELKEEMASTALTYVIFISFIILAVSPGLFALSKQLLIILSGFAERLGTSLSGTGTLPISFTGVAITPDQFTKFSTWSLTVIATFASMIVSIIQYGNIRSGIKYIPFFVITSLVSYNIFSIALGFVMSTLFTI